MATPSIGSLACFCISGDIFPASIQSTVFNKFGTDGVGLIKGAKRQVVCNIVSTHFAAGRDAADAIIKAAAAITGTIVDIQRDIAGSAVPNCYIKDFKVNKCGAAAGLPGTSTFVTEIGWEIIVPVDW